eukprot:750414-Hanusia_phi.AAC.6
MAACICIRFTCPELIQLWANLGTLNGISDPRKINWLEPSSANAQYPKAGENNTIESWAEKYNVKQQISVLVHSNAIPDPYVTGFGIDSELALYDHRLWWTICKQFFPHIISCIMIHTSAVG